MPSQFVKSGIVTTLATLIHMLIGATVIHSGWPALAANLFAFLVAFAVSFMGHYGFLFSDQAGELTPSFICFSLIACGGFAVNEGLLSLLIWYDTLPQIAALLLSTAIAATPVLIASRRWTSRKMADDN